MPLNLGPDEDAYRLRWPALRPRAIKSRSHKAEYNCAAWAMGEKHQWWQPPPHDLLEPLSTASTRYYWPDNVDWALSVDVYADAFATRDYVRCDDASFDVRYEKLAIYGNPANREFQHVARQLENGMWTSKLGKLKDITHLLLTDLVGEFYGIPLIYMRRPRDQQAP